MSKMTHLKQSLFMLALLLGLFGMVACDDYDVETFNYVDKTTVSLEESTLHSLTYKWTAVDNVTNYKWVLVQGNVEDSKENPLAQGTTTNTALVFENLDPGTNYTLWVTPISDSNLVSRSFYGTFATVAITPLDTPKVTCTLDTITYDVIAEWGAVENAVDYNWYYVEQGDTITDTTTDLSISFNVKSQHLSPKEWPAHTQFTTKATLATILALGLRSKTNAQQLFLSLTTLQSRLPTSTKVLALKDTSTKLTKKSPLQQANQTAVHGASTDLTAAGVIKQTHLK
jgi:hypothetical protein